MQLVGATPLELELVKVIGQVERDLPASKLATDIVVALSNAAAELQRLRGFWPQDGGDPTFQRCTNGDVIVIVPGRSFRIQKSHWCSHIANVSYHGEEDYGFYRAANFHYGLPPHESFPIPAKAAPEEWKDQA